MARGCCTRGVIGRICGSNHFRATNLTTPQSEIRFLGLESSPAFVREPEGNGCAERFIRTLKEQLLWIRSFRTIEEMRVALHAFKDLYNSKWIVQKHGYLTPEQAREKLIAVQESAA